MKRTTIILIILLIMSITITAVAGITSFTCDYNDGGEMIWSQWLISHRYLYSEHVYKNGGHYYIYYFEDTYGVGYKCNVNSSHTELVNTYIRYSTEEVFSGY